MASLRAKEWIFVGIRSAIRDQKGLLVCKNGFRTVVRRIDYELQKQRARLRYILKNLIRLVNGISFATTSPRGASAHVELSLILVLEITDWACAVKHEAFSEEHEWRLITYPRSATLVGTRPENYKGVLVRPTQSFCFRIWFWSRVRQTTPLVEIRCGPSQLHEQSGRALKILLRKQGYEISLLCSRMFHSESEAHRDSLEFPTCCFQTALQVPTPRRSRLSQDVVRKGTSVNWSAGFDTAKQRRTTARAGGDGSSGQSCFGSTVV